MVQVQKLYYFANYFPASKARHVQIAKMVDAFTDSIADVEFVVRDYRRDFTPDIKEYFNLSNVFNTVEITGVKFLPLKYDFLYHSYLKSYLKKIVNSSTPLKPVLYSRYGKNSGRLSEILIENKDCSVFIEVHEDVTPRELEYLKQTEGIIVISRSLKSRLTDSGVPDHKILVAQSCVDLDAYKNTSKDKNELRELLSLPNDKKLVLYSGHLYTDRGVEDLVDSAGYLDGNIIIVIVGGLEKDLNRVRRYIDTKGLGNRVLLTGKKPTSEIPLYQKSADVLVMPYPAKWKLKDWSSPMKMFEYMASRTPIVASDFPIIREVLNENNSLLVKPGEPEMLAKSITRCLEDGEFSESISNRAFVDVGEYTWDNRAKKIIGFIESRS